MQEFCVIDLLTDTPQQVKNNIPVLLTFSLLFKKISNLWWKNYPDKLEAVLFLHLEFIIYNPIFSLPMQ